MLLSIIKKLNTNLPYNPTILPFGIKKKTKKVGGWGISYVDTKHVHRNVHTASFIIARRYKQPKWASADERIHKGCRSVQQITIQQYKVIKNGCKLHG